MKKMKEERVKAAQEATDPLNVLQKSKSEDNRLYILWKDKKEKDDSSSLLVSSSL